MGFFDKPNKEVKNKHTGSSIDSIMEEVPDLKTVPQEVKDQMAEEATDKGLEEKAKIKFPIVETSIPDFLYSNEATIIDLITVIDPVKEAMAAALQITVENAPPGSAMKTHAEKALALYNRSK